MDLLYGESKYLISIDVNGPQIILPSQNNQGFFLIYLGHLNISNNLDICEGLYEQYNFQIRDLGLKFTTIDVVPSLCINTELSFMKSTYRKRKWDLCDTSLAETPDIIISGE